MGQVAWPTQRQTATSSTRGGPLTSTCTPWQEDDAPPRPDTTHTSKQADLRKQSRAIPLQINATWRWWWCWKDSIVESNCCSCRTRVQVLSMSGGSKLPVCPGPEDLTSSSGLHRHRTNMLYRQTSRHVYVNKILQKYPQTEHG